jgi:hypothetical protein
MPLSFYATAGYYDPQRDALFLVIGGTQLVKFDSAATYRTGMWHSKSYYLPSPRNMGYARVEASAYPVTMSVTATLRSSAEATAVAAEYPGVVTASGNKATYSVSVTDDRVFALPNGFDAKVWEYELQAANEVLSSGIAQYVQEFSNG